MARGKGKNWPKLKILAVLKSAHQKFSENALSKLKNSFCEIYYITPDTLIYTAIAIVLASWGLTGAMFRQN